MKFFKLTDKYQTTIPSNIRKFLHLQRGDKIQFKINDNKVLIDKFETNQNEYYDHLDKLLNEWSSTEDDEAYSDL